MIGITLTTERVAGVTVRPQTNGRRTNVPGHVYLLHFSEPVAHARHYIGWAEDGRLFRRLAQHEAANGQATPLVRALIQRGGSFTLARTWGDVDRFFERKLKNRRNASQLCPICRAANGKDTA